LVSALSALLSADYSPVTKPTDNPSADGSGLVDIELHQVGQLVVAPLSLAGSGHPKPNVTNSFDAISLDFLILKC